MRLGDILLVKVIGCLFALLFAVGFVAICGILACLAKAVM